MKFGYFCNTTNWNKKPYSKILEEAREIVFKTFADVLSLVAGTYYPPRSKKIANLIERI